MVIIFISDKVKFCMSDFSEGVNVIPNSTVEHVSFQENQVQLRLNHGEEVSQFQCCLKFALFL